MHRAAGGGAGLQPQGDDRDLSDARTHGADLRLFRRRRAAGVSAVSRAEGRGRDRDSRAPCHVPCNYLQCFENSMDEVHVAFTHAPGGSHARIAQDLPIITAEETDWGMMRYGKRKTGDVRHTIHYAPNMVRVIVPPLAGMDGVGGWPEIILIFTPVDDENCIWFGTSKVFVTGDEVAKYTAKRAEFAKKFAAGAADQPGRAGYLERQARLRRRPPSGARARPGHRCAGRPGPHRRPRERVSRAFRCRHHRVAQDSRARTARVRGRPPDQALENSHRTTSCPVMGA